MIQKFFFPNSELDQQTGSGLIEVLFYLAIMVLVMVLIVQALLLVAGTRDQVVGYQLIEKSAVLSLDRLTRFSRAGFTLDENSELNQDFSEVIIILDEEGSARARFFVDQGRLYLEHEGKKSFLTPAAVTVSRFWAESIETQESEALRLEIEFTYAENEEELAKTFYSTLVLRNSYEN